MNRLGMMVDVSHPSKASILQAIGLSKAPVIASHSSVRKLANQTRNLDDEMLMAIKTNGGVVQINALPTSSRPIPGSARRRSQPSRGIWLSGGRGGGAGRGAARAAAYRARSKALRAPRVPRWSRFAGARPRTLAADRRAEFDRRMAQSIGNGRPPVAPPLRITWTTSTTP